jgi:hypothetical protein
MRNGALLVRGKELVVEEIWYTLKNTIAMDVI